MATPHINAKDGAFADTVLMPGDPLRAKFIAENFLENAELVTDVRNIFGYTGNYKGRKVSVMAHGMGIPSVSIYATELFKDYGVKNIIRIGSCGAVTEDVKLRDIIIVTGASTDSKVNRMRFGNHDLAAVADYSIVASAVEAAKQNNLTNVHIGSIFSADLFYTPDANLFKVMPKYGTLAVEMEAAGLFPIAAEYGGKAGCILTVSDHIVTGESTTSEERQNTFKEMMVMALDTVLIHDKF